MKNEFFCCFFFKTALYYKYHMNEVKNKMEKNTTSNRLKEIMNERALKQVDILRLSEPYQKKLDIKMGKSTLSQYVNGVQSPDQDRIYLLSKTLNVSEPWLMGYDVGKERIPDEERGDLTSKKVSSTNNEENKKESREFYMIQRKTKNMTKIQQEKLLKLIELTFDMEDDDE